MDHFFLDDEGLRHLLERIKNYFASQTQVNSDLTDLLNRINNLNEAKADKSTLNTEINRIDSSLRDLSDNKVNVSTYDDDKSTIQSSINSLGTSISSLENKHNIDVSSIQSSLDEIESDISGLGSSKLDQSTYNTDKSEIDSEISEIKESLTGLGDSKASKNELNTEVERIDSSISTVNESIEGINSSIGTINTSIGTINTSIEEIDTSIETINGSIGSLEESVEGLDTSVSALESSVESIEGSIDDLGDSLSPVATSGDYSDLINKPTLSQVATSGSYNDLSDKPSIPDSPVQSDWNESDSSSLAYIQNKPTIPVVPTNVSSFTNDAGYITLSEVTEQQQSDWSQSDSTAPDFIKNKPTIPAAQVNSDWNSDSGVSQILNKPNLSPVAISGDYDDLENKPEIPTVNNPTITFTQGGTTKGTITLNQSENSTIALDAGSDDITEIANRMDTVEDTVSDLQELIENYDFGDPASKTYVANTVRATEERLNGHLEDHENDTNNPHNVTYNQVGLEVVEDIESEPEEPENPDPSEEPDYKYIASIDYVKQYVDENGIGVETLESLEGPGKPGLLYIYGETLYIWKDDAFTAVSTASSGVSRELEEKINTSYSHTFDTITNPHNITKGTLGLGNVDNTSDINKPLSNAAITELARKVNVAEIVDNLTTQSSVAPLSANMGYELSGKIAALRLEVNGIGSALRFKGTVPSRSDLANVQSPAAGDCYQIVSADGKDPDEGHMFSYTEGGGGSWVEISGSFGIDFVAASMDEVQSIIDSYQRPNSNQNENNQTGESEETGDGEDNGQTGEGGEGENDGQESEPVVDPNAESSGN